MTKNCLSLETKLQEYQALTTLADLRLQLFKFPNQLVIVHASGEEPSAKYRKLDM